MKYGFFSSKALLPGERWEDFVNFRQSLLEQLCPGNRFEDHVMDLYIPLAWRMRRLPEIEAFAFTRYGISAQGNQCGPGFGLVASVQTDNILGQLSRYEATLRKNAFKYLQLLLVLRKEATGEKAPPIGAAEVIDLALETSSPTESSNGAVALATEMGPTAGPDSAPGPQTYDYTI